MNPFRLLATTCFICAWACFSAASLADPPTADRQTPFRECIAYLSKAQQAVAEGKWNEAKSACTAMLEVKDAPPHLHWEARERLTEIGRIEKGMPPRDPTASRVVLPESPKPGRTFFVAPAGDDAGVGAESSPFRTIERARDAIRALKDQGGLPAGGVEVVLRGGEYPLTQSFELTAQDSGAAESPVVYRAYPGETPRFSGGVRVTGFQPVRDAAILARLPEDSRGKVLCADLKLLGIEKLSPLKLGGFGAGTHVVSELFCDGRVMTLARWPNRGFVEIGQVPAGKETGLIEYEGTRAERWVGESDAWLHGYWFFRWADSYQQIASIDTEKRRMTLVPPQHKYGYRTGRPFYALNILAELDVPGEWYLDRSNCMLYFWPPSDPEKLNVQLSRTETPLLVLRGVSNVRFERLTWELGAHDAIHVSDGDHCLFSGCTVRNFAGSGIEISGGSNHGILSCDIYSMGRAGAGARGGDRKTLTPGRHFVENCHIHDIGRIDRTCTPGVHLNGVGNRMAHNCVHDVSACAVSLGGNDNVVEYNEITRVVQEPDDQGAADMWGDPLTHGNVYRYNYWHHIGDWQRPTGGPELGRGGIRLDDAISGILIYGNVFYRASSGTVFGFGGVQIHGGKDNILDNNVFVDCEYAISFTAWTDRRWRNFVSKSLDSPAIDRKLFLARYPELARLSEDANRNTIARSLVVQCRKFLHEDSHKNQLFNNLVTAEDPGFRDAGHEDFQLSDTSAATQIGLRPIPMQEIGLYDDAFRKK